MIIILTFIAFTGLVALISWYKTKEENLSTKEGYFLAGRGLTGLVIAGSLEMTNLSTEQLVGQAGQSYSTNMGAMSWSVNASIALLALALIDVVARYAESVPVVPTVLNALSFYTRYYDFTAGLFDPASVLFYVSTAVIFNFFTVRVFEKRRWS